MKKKLKLKNENTKKEENYEENNILWLEKYRPKILEDYIGKKDDIKIQKIITVLRLILISIS